MYLITYDSLRRLTMFKSLNRENNQTHHWTADVSLLESAYGKTFHSLYSKIKVTQELLVIISSNRFCFQEDFLSLHPKTGHLSE